VGRIGSIPSSWQRVKNISMENINNPPAFPVEIQYVEPGESYTGVRTGYNSAFTPGMSLRDYFAAKAMQGMAGYFLNSAWSNETIVELSYQMADQMLKERLKKGRV
jgi:hypothetical protein